MIETRVSAARSVAFDLLRAVLTGRTPLDDALGAHDGLARLADRDRGFARTLVATTLRRLGHVDLLIERCLDRPLPGRASAVRDVLRIAATELLILGVAPHAAVDSAVTLVRSRGHEKFAKLTNAVLRRLDREARTQIAALPALAALPDWLAQGWVTAYGATHADAMATALMSEPPLDITTAQDRAFWAGRLDATILPTGTLRRTGGGRVDNLPGFADGAWWVQDMAAALPAGLVAAAPGESIVDLCAAPGGKTAQLAAAGAHVTAVERARERITRLERTLARLSLPAAIVRADATQWRPPAPVDAVLLDAPCSATGTTRRHPDIPWLKSRADINQLTALQDRLLDAALSMIRPGGRLVFCTCSLEPQEGPDRIDRLLSRTAGVSRVPVTASEVGNLAGFITADGDLRTRPDMVPALGGVDGFYASRLVRDTDA